MLSVMQFRNFLNSYCCSKAGSLWSGNCWYLDIPGVRSDDVQGLHLLTCWQISQVSQPVVGSIYVRIWVSPITLQLPPSQSLGSVGVAGAGKMAFSWEIPSSG